MTKYRSPFLFELPKIGESEIGFITPINTIGGLPFDIKRTYITYYTPQTIARGKHAHFITEQFLIAVNGEIIVQTENMLGNLQTFLLDSPNKGVYIPPNVWHSMHYKSNAVQLAFASTEYDEDDYIRNYDEFKKYWKETE